MNRRAPLRAWTLAALALGGCVAFESPPVAALSCDPALAGTWADARGSASRGPLTVDGQCHLRWTGAPGGAFTTTLGGFAVDGHRYLAFTAADADRLLEAEGDIVRTTPPGHVYLMRYRITGTHVSLWAPDAAVARAALDAGQIRGRRLDTQSVAVSGDAAASARFLRARGGTLFATGEDDAAIRFTRTADATR